MKKIKQDLLGLDNAALVRKCTEYRNQVIDLKKHIKKSAGGNYAHRPQVPVQGSGISPQA